MKMEAIFEHVGMNAEQIRAAALAASHPVVPGEPTVSPENKRIRCPYCARPVGKCRLK